jgi:hypothetical protein
MTQPSPLPFDYDVEVRKIIAESLDGETVDGIKELLADLPIVSRLDFDPRWEVGNPIPGTTDRIIFAMFPGEMAGDVRIYVYSTEAQPNDQKWFRYTASRVGATAQVEKMTRKAFVAEVADEWTEILTADEDDDEPEPSATPATPATGNA